MNLPRRVSCSVVSSGSIRPGRFGKIVNITSLISKILCPLSSVSGRRREFAFFEGLEKIVLGLNRGAAPAAGAVKLDDDVRALFHLDVVHTVFQRMERVETARATPAQFLGGVENDLRKNLQKLSSIAFILDERTLLVHSRLTIVISAGSDQGNLLI